MPYTSSFRFWIRCDGCQAKTPTFGLESLLRAWAAQHGWVGGERSSEAVYCPGCRELETTKKESKK